MDRGSVFVFSKHPPGMPADHKLLVCGDNQDIHGAGCSMQRAPVGGVCFSVNLCPQPLRPFDNASTHLSRMFTDAGREYDGIESPEHGCQRANFPGNSITKVLDCVRRASAGLVRRSRISALMPEIPNKPERW